MRKGLAAAGVVALIAAGSAACGTATASTPDAKVKNAFDKLGNQKSVTLGLHFGASADQLYTAMQGEEDFTKQTAKTLAALHANIQVSTGSSFKDVKDGDKGSFGFQLTTDSSGKKSLIEVRSVDQKVYLRADIKGLEGLGGDSVSAKDKSEFDQFLASGDQLPSSLASVKAALKGEWITIDPKAFTDFAKSMADRAGEDGADSPLGSLSDAGKGLDAKTQQKIVDSLRAALEKNATFKNLGKSGGADHVQVTVPARQLAKEVEASLGSLTRQIPDFKPSDLDDVPNKTIAVDVALKGGKLSGIGFDLAQLDDQAKGKVPLVLDIDGGADKLSAPEGAKTLNPQDLIGLFMSGIGGSDDSSSGSGSSSPDDSLFS